VPEYAQLDPFVSKDFFPKCLRFGRVSGARFFATIGGEEAVVFRGEWLSQAFIDPRATLGDAFRERVIDFKRGVEVSFEKIDRLQVALETAPQKLGVAAEKKTPFRIELVKVSLEQFVGREFVQGPMRIVVALEKLDDREGFSLEVATLVSRERRG
jgi:hypothetical protein